MKKILMIISVVLFVGLVSSFGFAESGVDKADEGEMEVVAIMYGHAKEGTWDPAAYQGLLKTQKKVGFKLSLNEGTGMQDAEKIIRNWAAKGVNVVFAHSLIYSDQLISVAKHYPDVYFIGEQIMDPSTTRDGEPSAYRKEVTPDNVLFMGDTPLEGNYMAGYAAALMSKTGIIGILQPFESPGLNRYSNSFLFGAQAAKPDINMKVVYIGDYIAPAETRDAVKSLAQQGCDVIFTEMDDNSAILEAAAQGIYVIPMYMDKHDVDSKTVLTSVVMGWHVPMTGAIEAAANGTWAQYREKHYFRPLSVAEGSLSLGIWGDTVPIGVKNALKKVQADIKSGKITVKAEDKTIIF